jgi:peptide/nickel transport system ATP-binding protein
VNDFVILRDVAKTYSGSHAGSVVRSVDGVSLTIGQGEVLGLVGETGCGKSTIARLLVGMTPPDRGEINIAGIERTRLTGGELQAMRRRVQLVFQDPHGALDPRMRIVKSLEAPLIAHGIGDAAERARRIDAMLDEVGLDASFRDRLPRECSGGQLQRIVIARALLLEPEFLICDEPTSALDASMRAQILNLLAELKRRLRLTLLMISHDLRVVRFVSDRIAVMYLGQIVELAPRDQLFMRPRHPYTRALLAASMIGRDELHSAIAGMRGEPPSPLRPQSGCRFHERCPHAEERCRVESPTLFTTGDGHDIRCHRWREIS